MLGATNTNTAADDQHELSLPASWTCATCAIRFEDQPHQRQHMKESWHVYNIKRRIVDLPAISREIFESQIQQSEIAGPGPGRAAAQDKSDNEASDSDEEVAPSPYQCLFCSEYFDSTDEGLLTSVRHMTTTHGFFLPDQDGILDMHSLLGYLADVVREWHECLSCGATRGSTAAVQSHMKDRGHCQLNLDREPELHEFWEDTSSPLRSSLVSAATHLTGSTESELSLPSGRLIGSRTALNAPFRTNARQSTALTVASSSSTSTTEGADASIPPGGARAATTRQLARRDEQGILGISVQQRGALSIAQQTAQRSEAAARRAKEWINNRSSNTQKTDQMDTTKIGKRGKQTHKLLPR